MKKQHIYVFHISIFLFWGLTIFAQTSEVETATEETAVRTNNSYGLRVGVDLQNIVTSFTNPRFRGIEFMGDYRISDKYFLAAELGNQEKTIDEININTTASGSYIKAGIDYNANKNLIGLRNVIFVGLRYGYANFSQTLNSFAIATQNNFFDREEVSGEALDEIFGEDASESGLSAHWGELIGGIKVELLNNFYLGFSVSVRRNIFVQQPEQFDNHFIPGFGATNDFGNVGAGFRYFVEYYFPFYKKKKKIKDEEK